MPNQPYDAETLKAVIREIRTADFNHKAGEVPATVRDNIVNHLERMLNPRIAPPTLASQGEVWLVEIGGRRRIARKADSSSMPWVVYDEPDVDISLDGTWMEDADIDRLVSPLCGNRDIKIPDSAPLVGSKWSDGMALDMAVPVGTVVKDEDGDIGWKKPNSNWAGSSFAPDFELGGRGHTWTILYLGE